MRFAHFISALAAMASITSALQDIPSADTSFIARRAPTAKKPQPTKHSTQPTHSAQPTPSSQVSVCKGKKAARNLRFMPRGDTKAVGQEGNVWYVREHGFLDASRVRDGGFAQVWDVTGGSAAFFFDTAGHASVAHLSAGQERAEATEAASKARQAGTFDSVVVYSPDSRKTRDIKRAIRAVLGDSVDVFVHVYRLSDLRRGESWKLTHRSGDAPESVTAAIAIC